MGKEAARTGKDWGITDWENRGREESGRELATKTEPGKIREEWETSGKKTLKKLERNQQELRRARKEPGRDGEGPEK